MRQCPQCGYMNDDTQQVCFHCQFDIATSVKSKRRKMIIIIAIVVGIYLAIVINGMNTSPNYQQSEYPDNKTNSSYGSYYAPPAPVPTSQPEETNSNNGNYVAPMPEHQPQYTPPAPVPTSQPEETNSNNGNYVAPMPEHQPQYTPPPEPVEKFTIGQWGAVNGEFGSTITGYVRNNTSDTIRYAQIEFTLYDRNYALVDSAFDNIVNWGPGEVWKFQAQTFRTGAAYTKIKGITGF